jgi:hypothetical protein
MGPLRRLAIVFLAGGALLVAGLASVLPAAAAPGCTTSTTAGYEVIVCITAPSDGASLSGNVTVTATVSVTGTNPGVRRMVFGLGGQYLLTDYQSPYTFVLPTAKFVDGQPALTVYAIMRDGFESSPASIHVTFGNGITQPPVNTNTFQPSSGTQPAPGQPFVLAVTGDGASGEANALGVTDMLASWDPNLFLYTGDVYEKGAPTEFFNWYGTSSTYFGRLKSVTNPTIGNHEFEAGVAPGYFDYWDNIPNYYSVDAGGWHVVVLNSNSQFGQFGPGSPQYQWLNADLLANQLPCTLVAFHHPVYSVGPQGNTPAMNDIWKLLVDRGADVVLTGHDHSYQRWQPLDRNGNVDPTGITQFVVGSGGHAIQSFVRTDPRLAVGADSAPAAYGALRMELNAGGAAYRYEGYKGPTVLDSGALTCSGAAQDTTPPSVPAGLAGSATSSNSVDLSWSASTDNVGVVGYDVKRDGPGGQVITPIGTQTTFTDTSVSPASTYTYAVRARDLAGNPSDWSSSVDVTTPAVSTVIFTDGFESGNLSQWTVVSGLTTQQSQVFSGAWAARALAPPVSQAQKYLGTPVTDVYYRLRFLITSRTGVAYLGKLRTATGSSIIGVHVSSTGKLAYRNDVAGVTRTSTTTVTNGVWHEVQLHVQIAGASSLVETWYDGAVIGSLTRTENLGSNPIGRLQLGDNDTNRTFDIAYDDLVLGREFVAP